MKWASSSLESAEARRLNRIVASLLRGLETIEVSLARRRELDNKLANDIEKLRAFAEREWNREGKG